MGSQNREHGLCTLCYKTIDHSNNNTSGDITRHSSKFVSLIFRHLLQQNGSSTLKPSSFPEAYLSLNKLTKRELSFNYVQICKDCEVNTQNFCNFYQQIKELELRLDFEISKICSTLENADKVLLKVKKFENHSIKLGQFAGSKLLELRKTLKSNIQTYKGTSAPRVYLSPLNFNESLPVLEHVQDFVPRAFSPINLDEPMTISNDNGNKFDDAPRDGQNGLGKNTALLLSTVIDTNATASTENHRSTSTPTKMHSDKFRCTSCPQRFRSKCTLDQHNIFKHIETYFQSTKLSSLANNQFKIYLHHTIEKLIDDFPYVESKYKCPHCYIPKLFVDRKSVKFHLVQHHRSVINEKLVELQSSKEKIPKLLVQFNKSINSRHVCSMCPKRFPENFKVQRHEATSHPEIFVKSSKLSNEDDETFQIYVRYVVEQQLDQQFVKLGETLNRIRPKRKCKICLKVLHGRTEAKMHIITKHDCIIVEKLNETRNSGKTFDEIKLELARFKHGGNAKYCPPVVSRKINDPTSAQYTECTICHKETGSSYKLSQHEALHHPVQFFKSAKSDLVTNTQFSLFVKDLLSQVAGKFDKIKSSVSKKGRFKCSLCPKVFGKLFNVRVHVLLVHFDKLAEKLKKLQEDFELSCKEIRFDKDQCWIIIRLW